MYRWILFTNNREDLSGRHERRRGLHEEADGQEAVAEAGVEGHEDGEEDERKDHVVRHHQRPGLQKPDDDAWLGGCWLVRRSTVGLLVGRSGLRLSALPKDDKHGVGVVEEVEDSEAHVMSEQVVSLVHKVVAAFSENWKRRNQLGLTTSGRRLDTW